MKKSYLLSIGIFLVATIAGASVSYISSLSEEDFFLGEADDVLVVTGTGSVTPVTSNVPEYLVKNLELIPGIVTCSPEIISIGIVNNRQGKTVVIRGVEPGIFSAIDKPRLLEGEWFNRSAGTDQPGLMAGKEIAELLDITTGDELVISSTMRDTTLLVKVSGIIETDTPFDDELILSRELAKILTDLEPGSTTLIRVVFDKDQIDKQVIRQLVNAQFEVPVKITALNGSLDEFFTGSISIKVFSYTNELVALQKIQDNDLASFILPFGQYFFEAIFDPPSVALWTRRVAKFVNASPDEPLQIYVEKHDYEPYISIKALFEERGLPVTDLPVTLTDEFSKEQETAETDDEGIVEFSVKNSRLYALGCTWSGLQWSKTFFASQNISLAVDLSTDLVFSINNASTMKPIATDSDDPVFLTLLKREENSFTSVFDHEPIVNTSRSVLTLVPGRYNLTLDYGSFSRTYVFQQGFTRYEEFFIGNGTLEVRLVDNDGTPIHQARVTAIDLKYISLTHQTFTNSSGFANLELTAGRRYLLNLSKDSLRNQYEFFFDRNQHLDTVLDQNYPFEVRVYDGGSPNKLGINGVLLELIKENETYQQLTDSSGKAVFYLPDRDTYTLQIQDGGNIIPIEVSIQETPSIEIPLGNLVFDVSVFTPVGYPLEGATVRVFNQISGRNNLLVTNITDGAGRCKLETPAVYGISTSITITVSFQDATRTWIRTFSSSNYQQVDFYFEHVREKTFFEFRNIRDQPVNNLLVKIIPLSDDFDYFGWLARTNATGIAAFDNLNLGVYRLYYYWEEFQVVYDITIDSASNDQPLVFSIQIDEILDIFIDPASDSAALLVNKWPGDRQYLVVDTTEYTQTFFSTALSIITVTLFSLIVIVSTISFLMVASMVSFPVFQQADELKIIKRLGASNEQVAMALAAQFTFITLLSSVAGVLVGYLILTSIASLGTANIGGILLVPRFNLLTLAVIVIIACLTVFVRTAMEVNKTIGNI